MLAEPRPLVPLALLLAAAAAAQSCPALMLLLARFPLSAALRVVLGRLICGARGQAESAAAGELSATLTAEGSLLAIAIANACQLHWQRNQIGAPA